MIGGPRNAAPISVRREHPAEPMIPDVSLATGTNSKSAAIREYLHLFESSAALDAKRGFKMVVHRLLAKKESVQVASQDYFLPHVKGKDVIPSGPFRVTSEGRRCPVISS